MPKERKKKCSCPPTMKGVCACRTKKLVDCRDVSDVIDILKSEADNKRDRSKISPKLKFVEKEFVPRHYKDTCVPMTPSMHTRMRFIRHCLAEAPKRPVNVDSSTTSTDSSEDETGHPGKSKTIKDKLKSQRKKVAAKRCRFFDLMPQDILLPTPVPMILHAPSDNDIVKLSSPKTSGEVIKAEKAAVAASEFVSPMPPKSAYDIYKPHSGIFLNLEKDFVADVVDFPGPSGLARKRRRKKPHPFCRKGKVCNNKLCRKIKCRRHNRIGRFRGRSQSGGSFSTKSGRRRVCNTGIKNKPADDCGLDGGGPEHVKIPYNIRRGALESHSLTFLPCTKDKKPHIHYGILTGSYNMYDPRFGAKSRGKQALVMSVMAYCLAFHYHPKQWTMKLLDNLVDAGDKWYQECLDRVHDHSAVAGMCEVLPFGKKQTLTLNGKRMRLYLGDPDVIGYTLSKDPTVYNLCRGLKAFFKDNRAGVLLTRVLKVVIWRDRICFYIFDPAGRDSRAQTNFAKGAAALINIKDLESVAEVLLARAVVDDQKYLLAPLKVIKILSEKDDEDIESDKELTQAEKAMLGYRILDENRAIVNANMHLGAPSFEDAKYRQALPVAVVALTYAKISPPNTWNTKTLDKILRLGNKLYLNCMHPKVLIDLCIDNIPNEITIGAYNCEIIIYRDKVKGQLFTPRECLFNIATGLEEFFKHEWNCGILEFNNYTLAVWRQKEMYYLFDPYPRSLDGGKTMQGGKACVMMLLNVETVANAFTENWSSFPATTAFVIHGFKVLRLKKRDPRARIVCTLSDERMPCRGGRRLRRQVLAASARGAGEHCHDVYPDDKSEGRQTPLPVVLPPGAKFEEENMGDILSLVDSIQEGYVPPIPLRYKNMPPDDMPPKVANLDSPTVSVTQIVPPWPKPRDKTNEPPEPDPDPEPSPPPTPPPPPEGAEEAEEEQVMDEEMAAEEARRRAEEEEARRKALELPPPLPPPPPTPQPDEEELAPAPLPVTKDDEIPTLEPENVERRVLLTEDAKKRFKLRQLRKKINPPLTETQTRITPCEELKQPSNFKTLPDSSQIIIGSQHIPNDQAADMMPFAGIMAIVTSYKYSINTWTAGIVNFIVDASKKLYQNKLDKFQFAPVHIIPRITIGSQTYEAIVDVVGEGATWQFDEILGNKFFTKHDRGLLTTCNYSCAIFYRNGIFYLYDSSPCNPMGVRQTGAKKGNACFMRFKTLHDLGIRIMYNKDGLQEDQQFILSRIVVRRLMVDPRLKLPDDYDYATRTSANKKSKLTLVAPGKAKDMTSIKELHKQEHMMGYHLVDGVYKIEGTTSLPGFNANSLRRDVLPCHFVGLVAMLMATMHPVRTWDSVMVDTCIEKGQEIYDKANNLNVCEKRAVKNLILDGRFIDINIKKLTVVNANAEKTVEQYMRAVVRRLRYCIVQYPSANVVVCHAAGYYHLFDPYPRGAGATDTEPTSEPDAGTGPTGSKTSLDKRSVLDIQSRLSSKSSLKAAKSKGGIKKKLKSCFKSGAASWTLYHSIEGVIDRLLSTIPAGQVHRPEFYSFELTSVKKSPKYSALNCKLSPLFKPETNPNQPYRRAKRSRALVDEKMYWLSAETVPWSRMNPVNDFGFERRSPRAVWNDWDIEIPGDLYSVWGKLHPLDEKFEPAHRGKQYLATCVVALAMSQACSLNAWTGNLLDGIVVAGDRYHGQCAAAVGSKPNAEIEPKDLPAKFDMFPYSFTVKFELVIFGFVYNMLQDRFNLSKALSLFFEKKETGVLVSPGKNLGFGKVGKSYFMFDCQTYGLPIFAPQQGAAYMLSCESLNRLIYCMTITLNIKRHGTQFHLYSAAITLSTKTK